MSKHRTLPMSHDVIEASEAILSHLKGHNGARFIGEMVDDISKTGQIREASLRAAVWIMAGQGSVEIDSNFNAKLPEELIHG